MYFIRISLTYSLRFCQRQKVTFDPSIEPGCPQHLRTSMICSPNNYTLCYVGKPGSPPRPRRQPERMILW